MNRLRSDRAKMEICSACQAVGHGNMTCRWCVAQWPRFGISQDSVDQILKGLGDRLPDPPFGTRYN